MSSERPSSARATIVRAQRTALTIVLSIFVGSWVIVGLLLAPVVGGWRTIAAAVLVLTVAPLSIFFRSRGSNHYPGKAIRLFVFRPMWYAQLLLILAALGGIIGTVLGAPFGAAGVAGRVAIAGVATVFLLLGVIGYAGSRRLVSLPLTVSLPSLPDGLEGLRIALICDTHIGPHSSRAHLARVAAAVRASNPDLIAVAGDLIDDYAPDVSIYSDALGDLTAPLGVYVIAGNHEVYAGWDEVLPRLRALSHTVLVNESRIVEHRGVKLAIAGTGDPAAGRRPGGGGSRTRHRSDARGNSEGNVHGGTRAQSGVVAAARERRCAAHAERAHALGAILDQSRRMEPRESLSRACDGRVCARRFAALRESGDELLGNSVSRWGARGSHDLDFNTWGEGGSCRCAECGCAREGIASFRSGLH